MDIAEKTNAKRPEQTLLTSIHETARQMENAVSAARAIGPEWENVLVDIQLPLLDQLSELSLRLRDRLASLAECEGAESGDTA